MSIKNNEISKLEDFDKLRSAPKLNKKQTKIIYNQVKDIIHKADWVTIGIMSPSLKEGIIAIRRIEKNFKYNEMKFITLPTGNGPIFLKANQKSGEIHVRTEYGLGEGILISCHHYNDSLDSRTIGPFPLNFFN